MRVAGVFSVCVVLVFYAVGVGACFYRWWCVGVIGGVIVRVGVVFLCGVVVGVCL